MHDILIDPYPFNHHVVYAIITLCICLALQLLACAYARRDQGKFYDTASGLSVALACIAAYEIRGTHFERQTVSTCLVTLWGVRLSWYLRQRHVAASTRVNPGELLAPRLLWGLSSSLPTVLCNLDERERMAWTHTELAGVVLAIIGLFVETLADEQKRRWHMKNATSRPAKDSQVPPVCAHGLWSISRHPNYMGEIAFQFGIFFICWDAIPAFLVICPILIFLMLTVFDGAMLTIERVRNTRFAAYPAYITYKQTTPLLFPRPSWTPRVFRKLCCLECACYDDLEQGEA